jgi:hypothetical protein
MYMHRWPDAELASNKSERTEDKGEAGPGRSRGFPFIYLGRLFVVIDSYSHWTCDTPKGDQDSAESYNFRGIWHNRRYAQDNAQSTYSICPTSDS